MGQGMFVSAATDAAVRMLDLMVELLQALHVF